MGSQAQARLLLWGEEGSTCKGKISTQIKSWRVVDFSSNIFLAQLSRQFVS